MKPLTPFERKQFLSQLAHMFSTRDRDWQKYEDYDGSYGAVADKLHDVMSKLDELEG